MQNNNNNKKLFGLRIALAVQWFGLRTLTAKSLSLIPAQGTKIIPQAAVPSKDKTKQNKQTNNKNKIKKSPLGINERL